MNTKTPGDILARRIESVITAADRTTASQMASWLKDYLAEYRAPLPILTPEQVADGWLEWHGGECPVFGGSSPKYMLRSGEICNDVDANLLLWGNTGNAGNITAYRPDPYEALKKSHSEGKMIQNLDQGGWVDWRVPMWNYPPDAYRVKPEPVMVPLGPEDVKCSDEIKPILGHVARYAIVEIASDGICTHCSKISWTALRENDLISRDGGKTWHRCEKPEDGK